MFRRVLNKIHPAVFLRAAKVASTTISEHEERLIEICKLTPEEALAKMGVTEAGLNEEQVEEAAGVSGRTILGQRRRSG